MMLCQVRWNASTLEPAGHGEGAVGVEVGGVGPVRRSRRCRRAGIRRRPGRGRRMAPFHSPRIAAGDEVDAIAVAGPPGEQAGRQAACRRARRRWSVSVTSLSAGLVSARSATTTDLIGMRAGLPGDAGDGDELGVTRSDAGVVDGQHAGATASWHRRGVDREHFEVGWQGVGDDHVRRPSWRRRW